MDREWVRSYICESIKSVVRSTNLGYMEGIAYDTAWVAMLERGGNLLFPRTIVSLMNKRKSNGSWGCMSEHYHDNTIATAATMYALAKHNMRKYNKEIEDGRIYIEENIEKIEKDTCDTIGYEIIFPMLVDKLEKVGIHISIPSHIMSKIWMMREKKLNQIPPEMIYTNKTTISYSLEFLGDDVDVSKIKRTKCKNGSVGNSPAATSYMLNFVHDNDAMIYLRRMLMYNSFSSAMAQWPYEIFERAWVLYHLNLFDVDCSHHGRIIAEKLKSSWTTEGVSWSYDFPALDSDDTAVTFKILKKYNYEVNDDVFENFEKEEHFICFQFEKEPSVSANIHILDAIKDCNSYERKDEVIDKIVKFLKRTCKDGRFDDKWNISPYYTTGHAIIALADVENDIVEKSVDYIISTQNENGSWGLIGGNREETAYALQGLLYYHLNIEKIDTKIMEDGVRFLLHNLSSPFVELWVSKGLYAPINVALSAELSVIYIFIMHILNGRIGDSLLTPEKKKIKKDVIQ